MALGCIPCQSSADCRQIVATNTSIHALPLLSRLGASLLFIPLHSQHSSARQQRLATKTSASLLHHSIFHPHSHSSLTSSLHPHSRTRPRRYLHLRHATSLDESTHFHRCLSVIRALFVGPIESSQHLQSCFIRQSSDSDAQSHTTHGHTTRHRASCARARTCMR